MNLAATGFEASVEQSLSEQLEADPETFPPLISDVFAEDLLAAEKEKTLLSNNSGN